MPRSVSYARKVYAEAFVMAGEREFQIPALEYEACAPYGPLKCPLRNLQSYVYKGGIFVNPGYPQMFLIAKWKLRDDRGQTLACVMLPISIVAEDSDY